MTLRPNLLVINYSFERMIYKISFYLLLLFAGCRVTNVARATSDDYNLYSENSQEQTDNSHSSSDSSNIQSGNTKLIFQSGFEPDSEVINQTSNTAEITGTDYSLRSLSSWKTDLEGN